jgi:lysophospholipase L1-like esterase
MTIQPRLRGVARRLREIAEVVAVVAASALAVFALGEIATRLLDRTGQIYDVEMFRYSRLLKQDAPPEASTMHHWHIPGASAVLQGAPVAINSKGLRDYEYEYALRPGVTRILALGDSVTFGWGVRLEDTYPKVLERLLNGGEQRGRYEVLNCGVGNYTTSRIIGLYDFELRKYQPSVVIFAFYLNNANDTPDSRWKALFDSPLEFPVFLWSRLQAVSTRYGVSKSFDEFYRDLYSDGNPQFARFRANLSGFLRELRDEGKIVIVASIPDMRDLERPTYRFQFVTDQVAKIAHDEGVHFVDLFPAVAGIAAEKILNTPEDRHPNAEGHRRMAQALYEALRAIGVGAKGS